MASPQKENGYTPIANELLDAIFSFDFSKRELQVILCIARMTYGYSKKEDFLSGWQIAEMTKIDRSHVSKAINSLIQKKAINRSDSCRISHGHSVPALSINKHYDEWITVAESAPVTVAESATVAKSAPVLNRPHTVAESAPVTVAESAIRPLPKQPTLESNTKTIKTIPKTNMRDFDEFWMRYPKKTGKDSARGAWEKKRPRIDDVMFALSWQTVSDQWQRNGGQYIPNPATYINQGRWQDEPLQIEEVTF
jgi:phage replication O-like protein O